MFVVYTITLHGGFTIFLSVMQVTIIEQTGSLILIRKLIAHSHFDSFNNCFLLHQWWGRMDRDCLCLAHGARSARLRRCYWRFSRMQETEIYSTWCSGVRGKLWIYRILLRKTMLKNTYNFPPVYQSILFNCWMGFIWSMEFLTKKGRE